MTVIVDTDIFIDASRGVPEAITYLNHVIRQDMLAISVISYMEMIIGCRNKGELQALQRFVSQLMLVNVSESVSSQAVDLLHRYRLSHGLLLADALIAATALSLEHSFATKNQRDYRFITGLRLLAYP